MVRLPVVSEAMDAKVEIVLNSLDVSVSERLVLKNSLLKLKSLNQQGLSFAPKDRKAAALLAIYQLFDK